MDKKIALSKYQSNPQVKKILEFIREDKNWIYDLFNLVQKRVRHFLRLLYFQNKELENNLVLIIFGNMLLSIVELDTDKFLTLIYPRRIKFKTEAEKKSQKGGDIGSAFVIAPYDARRLIKNSVNKQIDKFLSISSIFIHYMKNNESLVLDELLTLFKEQEKLKEDLNSLYWFLDLLTSKSSSKFQKSNVNKPGVGAKPKFNSKEKFLEALKSIPKDDRKSLRMVGKALKLSANTVKKYIEEYSIDLFKL